MKRQSESWIGAALVALLALLVVSPSHASECHLACVGKDPNCTLKSPAGVGETVGRNYRKVSNCPSLNWEPSGDQRLELRYRHKGRWFSPASGVPAGPLKPIFDKYPADACSIPSPDCIQARMNGMVAAVGGHGIDDKASKPGGEGNPCLIALPCGVVLPPSETWDFRLADAGISGTWTLKLARGTPPPGQPPEVSVYIKQGLARMPGAWFAPGAQYVYRFVDDAGRASSTGEFSIASRATRDSLQALTQRRVAQGLPESIAWADTLAANQLEWDAYQLTLTAKEPR